MSVEYCWLIISDGVVHGGGFIGIPGGSRPHRRVMSSTNIPRWTLIDDRCFVPRFGTSSEREGWGGVIRIIIYVCMTDHVQLAP